MFQIKKITTLLLVVAMVIPAQAMAQEPEGQQTTSSSELTLPPRLTLRMPTLEYSLLRSGQRLTASSDTILMSPEEFAKINIEFDTMQSRHNLYLEQQVRYLNERSGLTLNTLRLQNQFLESELGRTNELLIRSQEMRRNDLTPLWVAVGFVAGALTAIGIVYAVVPAGDM